MRQGTPNQTLETNVAPPLHSMLDCNSDAPFVLDLAFPAAVAQVCVRHFNDDHTMKQSLPILICCLAMCFSVGALAAERLAFPADLTHGNVRLVLMSVGQTTVFPNEKDTGKKGQPWQNGKQGVPCFTVTFLVELLGDRPYEPKTIKASEF